MTHTILCLVLNWLRDSGSSWLYFSSSIVWQTHTKSFSYSHRWLLLLSTYTCDACHTCHTRGWRKWGLQGPVGTLRRVQEGRGGRDWVGVADVLRMQELTLVGHDLCCLLTVQHREVGGHVDVYTGVWGQAAWGLGAQNGGWSRTGDRASGGGRGRGAGWGGCARLTGGGAPGSHHGDGLQETPTPGGRFLFGSEATTAAHSDHWSKQDERHEDRPHNQERHIDGHCTERESGKKTKIAYFVFNKIPSNVKPLKCESNLEHCHKKVTNVWP